MFCTCTELNYNQNLCSVLRRLGALFQVIKQWDGHVSAAVYLTRTQLPLLSGNISAQPRHLLANTHIHVVIDDGVSSSIITVICLPFQNKIWKTFVWFCNTSNKTFLLSQNQGELLACFSSGSEWIPNNHLWVRHLPTSWWSTWCVSGFGAMKSAGYSWVFVVTELVVSGAECKWLAVFFAGFVSNKLPAQCGAQPQ